MKADHNRFDHHRKPLKAVIMSNKRNPGKPQLQRRAQKHLFYKLPAEHTTKSLTSQWISESSINVCAAAAVRGRTALGDAGGASSSQHDSVWPTSSLAVRGGCGAANLGQCVAGL